MNLRRRRFVAEYLKDHNATRAAQRAGYTAKDASKAGSELLSFPEVRRAVRQAMDRAQDRAELSAARVLEEYRRIAFANVADVYDRDGNVIPLHLLPVDVQATIAGVEHVMKNATAGDGQIDRVLKVKVWDKVKALDSLAKHFGLLIERHEHSLSPELLAELDRVKALNAQRGAK